MQLSKLEDDFDSFRLVGPAEAPVGLAAENTLATLEDQMRTDWVLMLVKFFREGLLLRQEDYSAEVSLSRGRCVAAVVDRVHDVVPDVGGIVAIQVDDLLRLSVVGSDVFIIPEADFILCEINWLLKINRICRRWRLRTIAGNLIKVVLICFRTNNVNHLMERHFGMQLTVSGEVFAKDPIVRNLVIAHRWQTGAKGLLKVKF